jgi:plastocyanin
MIRWTRGTVALFAVLISACASSNSPAPVASTAAPTAAPVNIDVQAFKFPANVDVAKGTTVTWTNKDTTAHTVTSGTRPTKDGKFDGQLPAAGTFSFTFTDSGTYQYFCSIHSSMTGTITVK